MTSSFSRLSMGVKFGIRAPRSEVIQSVMPGTRYFFTFRSGFSPQSEQLSDEPIAPRLMAIRMAVAAARSTTPFEEYWSTPWHRSRAPANLPQGMRVVWSRRIGM